jgi:Tfp pilus assembly PilM family ATPase
MLFKKPKRLLGIDITANAIRLIELSYPRPNNYKIEACLNIALEAHCSEDVIIEKLKEIAAKNLIKTRDTAIALSHAAVIFKELDISFALTAKEIIEFLKFNIKKHLSESGELGEADELIGNINFDYYIDPATKTKQHAKIKVFATKSFQVARYLEILKKANFCPKIIDINSYAAARAIFRQVEDVFKPIAVININYESILIVIINNKKIIYAHEDFVDIKQMVTKIQLVFARVLQQPEKIFLAGEEKVFSLLQEEIASKFKIPIVIAEPFFGLQHSLNVAPEMLVSCGLAMRVADDD